MPRFDEAVAAGDLMVTRRLEDERYAAFAEASIVFLDLPDAVFRGYEGDDQLMAMPRADDTAPIDLLVREIVRLEPQKIYLPLGIGDHVDHQLTREVGAALLAESRKWVMPGPEYAGIVTYYEDFPYAWWNGFSQLGDLPAHALAGLPEGVGLTPEYADIGDMVDRKIPRDQALREPDRSPLRECARDGGRGPRVRTQGGGARRPDGRGRALLDDDGALTESLARSFRRPAAQPSTALKARGQACAATARPAARAQPGESPAC